MFKALTVFSIAAFLAFPLHAMTPKNTTVTVNAGKEHTSIMKTIEKSNSQKTAKKIIIVNIQVAN